MKYINTESAVFLSRPNRFTAEVETSAGVELCHVKNTARCRELLTVGADIYVQRFSGAKRKTCLDLISVKKDGRIVNIDSEAPNQAAYDYIKGGGLFGGADLIKREKVYKESRIDLYLEKADRKIFAEVKGVTLFDGDTALFPDAPTERGIKHLHHLTQALEEGYEAWMLFVIQAEGLKLFTPNVSAHKEFAEALADAARAGVRVAAFDCVCTQDEISIRSEVGVRL